uniref:Uncharacterized protein n=1 Tax=Arundo donax TaxID=35708 RepID=A0A0A8ZBJ5_ARUDO
MLRIETNLIMCSRIYHTEGCRVLAEHKGNLSKIKGAEF